MTGTIIWAVIMALFVGINIAVMFDSLGCENYGLAISSLLALMLCSISCVVYTKKAVDMSKQTPEVIETRVLPKVDTVITTRTNAPSDTLYVYYFQYGIEVEPDQK